MKHGLLQLLLGAALAVLAGFFPTHLGLIWLAPAGLGWMLAHRGAQALPRSDSAPLMLTMLVAALVMIPAGHLRLAGILFLMAGVSQPRDERL